MQRFSEASSSYYCNLKGAPVSFKHWIQTHIFVAVECKKPWDFLALDIFRKGRHLVVLFLADSRSLIFDRANYNKEFGPELGESLYKGIEEELKACRDDSIATETIRMQICVVLWDHFGIQWLDTFKCIQVSRKSTPPQGVDDMAGLFHDMNVCLVLLVEAEVQIVFGSEFILLAGFTSKLPGKIVIVSWGFTYLF
jgi:hypothetical protein